MAYFEIGIFQPRNDENIGTLWRSAWQLGAAGIFTIGRKQRRQTSDVLNVPQLLPYRQFETLEVFLSARPAGAQVIGVEFGGTPLGTFKHPERAIYLLGSEANGLSKEVIARCNAVVQIESVHYKSYNVAIAGSIVMYHRLISGEFSLGKNSSPSENNPTKITPS
jgi:tRNA G18 (ribose-2'-O)-methylase SpoU